MIGQSLNRYRVTAALGAGGMGADLAPFSAWDVAPDGRRFLMIESADTQPGDRGHLTFATNWFGELERLAPTKGKR